MGILDGLLPVVQNVLDTFGTAATLHEAQEGAHDPTTGTNVSPPIDRPIKVVDAKHVRGEGGSAATGAGVSQTGATVRDGARRLLAAPDGGSRPKAGDTITIGADTWRVISADIVRGTDAALLWDIEVRK